MLGGGINGAAIARELLLNNVPVCLVDTADLASGATAYSSRLIHGGLRYLEFGEFDLVRESLSERTRLLKLAPQFVRPLRFFVPVANRFGGLWPSLARFAGLSRVAPARHGRGLYLVRSGLWCYDRFARDKTLPRRAVHRVGDDSVPPVDPGRFRWLCSYSDAQIVYPERFVLALLADAKRIATERGLWFRVFTYHEAKLRRDTVELLPVGNTDSAAQATLRPLAIINCTGAWVDHTLSRIGVSSERLIGGTKGSHLITQHSGLHAALGGRAIYVEAEDGRPIFLLPLGERVLIGTTDLPFDGSPESAVATEDEIHYLLAATNAVFPQLQLRREDVSFHYSGVRPLPFVGDGRRPAAITRRHLLEPHFDAPLPMWSVIGGKLTTCRSLAEETVDAVLRRLALPVVFNSQDRPLPGGENYPVDETALRAEQRRIAEGTGMSIEQVATVWTLVGSRTEALLARRSESDSSSSIAGTKLPFRFVQRVLDEEWPRRLSDLVERRLMLLYHEPLSRTALRQLAQQLVAQRLLPESKLENEIETTCERLRRQFGKQVL